MLRLNVRYGASLGGVSLDFEIRRLPRHKDKALFIVDAAIRSARTQVSGKDLRVKLLDGNGQPLLSVFDPVGRGILPAMRWSGKTSAHKAQVFMQTAADPGFVELTAFGDSKLLPLDPRSVAGEGQEAANQQEPEGDSEETDGDDDDGHDDENGQDDDDAKCCPESFVTPDGAQPTVQRPDGAGGRRIICRPWTIQATFNAAPDPCDCQCCEYRQYVQGHLNITMPLGVFGDIVVQNLSPDMDYTNVNIPIPFGPPLTIPIVRQLGNTWGEDTIMVPGAPGHPTAYGHRDDMGTPQFDDLLQDYPDDCSYWAWDQPEFDCPAALRGIGFTFHAHVNFYGVIIDTCNEDKIAGPKAGPITWDWNTNVVL